MMEPIMEKENAPPSGEKYGRGLRHFQRKSNSAMSGGLTNIASMFRSALVNTTNLNSGTKEMVKSTSKQHAMSPQIMQLMQPKAAIGVTPAREEALKKIHNLNDIARQEDLESEPSLRGSLGSAGGESLIDVQSIASSKTACDDEPKVAASHPTYGKLLADFGFKRVYQASAIALCSQVPIWHLQRPTDPKRIAEIVEKRKLDLKFQGVVSIFDFEKLTSASVTHPQKSGIYDGQHRIHAIHKILEIRNQEDFSVLVEVYPVETEDDVKLLFLEKNKAEIVQEIDLPNTIASSAKVIIDEACNIIHKKFPEMFGNERCRAPNVHLPTLRNELFKANVISLYPQITTSEHLVDLIERCNARLKEKPTSYWSKGLKRNLPKAKKQGFYLGLCKDWVQDILIDDILS